MKKAAPANRFYIPDFCRLPAVLGLVLFGELMAIALALARTGLQGWDWTYFGLVSLLILWVVLGSAAALCRLRPWLLQQDLLRGSLVSYCIILLLTAAFSALVPAVPDAKAMLGLVVNNVLISAIISGIALRYFYIQQQLAMQRQAELQARIQALQSRIRPHFLFNSMNIIASLISINPGQAEEVVEDLAELFRASLGESGQVPLEQELAISERYLHIERLRLGERLRVEWRIGEACRGVLVPHLSLQPLLENAVYHGIQPAIEGGLVTIEAKLEGDSMRITVSNPYNENRPSQHQGNHMALENIQYRLQAFYNDDATFSAAGKDGIFVVSFTVPVAKTDQPLTGA